MNQKDFEIENGVLIKYRGKGSSVGIPNKFISIAIPEGVTKVGKSAFSCCNGIESVIIPDGVEIIGHNAFYGCKNLKNVQIPDSVKIIKDYAFSGCKNLKYARIPETASHIGENIFQGDTSLESYPEGFVIHHDVLLEYVGNEDVVIVPESVWKIRSKAFCWNDMHTLIIPDTVEKIESDPLWGCSNIRSITLHHITFTAENNQPELYWKPVYKLICSVWNLFKNIEHDGSIAYLNKRRRELFCLDTETFRKLLETGKIFTENVIDNDIRYANEHQHYEKQVLLTEYKYQHFGFRDISDKLKL